MMVWLLALVLFLVWAVATFIFGKGGFVHILLFNAVAIALVQLIHDRRAARQ
ncbi:MAG TPA: lmo0937 family membrane protein [Pyrinomonadaceae bacterium]|nr:lmo0937 family membrane protein [Pyrinomonadaceae bacterium]